MARRTLYIACYDVAEAKRLRAALHVLRHYATGGQKSVFECFLTLSERRQLLDEMAAVIDSDEDRFLLLPLDARRRVRVLGCAIPPIDPEFFYIG